MAAVAIGAFAAAGAGQTLQAAHASPSDGVTPLANGRDAAAAFGVGGNAPAAPEIMPVARSVDPASEASKLAKSQRISDQRAAKEAEARRPLFVKPADGVFSSGFGARWGVLHAGIDLAGPLGTPIVAAADGEVIDAGPASGFGMWIRVRLDDGTINVYGHMYKFNVHVGQRVKAGDLISWIGNNGFSTGPHLHFEVWEPGGMKINPLPWLNERGVSV
ncbi:M23 family metallopeptidase [Solihabitans fulvus]|uniref:M23 family metallopeptidase n=1 Tax=Solihabitans fulvus TaxID=1892852 RepID=UPI001CB762AD|nr:M23 family metallopeptidase [Solihabitans fulvus]